MLRKLLPLLSLLTLPLIAQAHMQAEKSSGQTVRVPFIENENVKVWKTTIMPNRPLNMHRYDSPRVIVPLTDGCLEVVQKTGETSELVFQQGKPIWLDQDLPGTMHADLNLSDRPIEVIVIEMKK